MVNYECKCYNANEHVIEITTDTMEMIVRMTKDTIVKLLNNGGIFSTEKFISAKYHIHIEDGNGQNSWGIISSMNSGYDSHDIYHDVEMGIHNVPCVAPSGTLFRIPDVNQFINFCSSLPGIE